MLGNKIKRLSLTLAVPAVLAVGLGASVFAAPGKDHKTTICHNASGTYHQITVADPALPAHFAHGDVMPDDYGECP